MPIFVARYPEIHVDVVVSNHLEDIVARGADAGIRYGGTVPEDMIAQRLTPDIRWVVAGASAYLDHYGVPEHPHDLIRHRCLRVRLGDERIYLWEFERNDQTLEIDVPGAITIDNTAFALDLVQAGVALAYLPEPCVAPLIARGSLAVVLADWSVKVRGSTSTTQAADSCPQVSDS